MSLTFDVRLGAPLVTLVSMIAPSPDWFVGVAGLSLVEGGDWRDEVVVELFAYDAGTDSGPTYTSSNQVTQPQAPITKIQGGPFNRPDALGSFRFTRISG